MIKIQGLSNLFICLSFSLLLNIILLCFFSSLYYFREPELTWSRRAASEAEAVAAISCSGHGRAFLDGILDDGVPVCECNTCYAGHDCSELLPDCPADADRGDPLFLEHYWRQDAASGAVVVVGWHRMSYDTNGDFSLSVELERHIRLLHKFVGNALTEGKFILFGTGSTQLLNAAVHALSLANDSPLLPAAVVASAPYYPDYEIQTDFFRTKKYEWRGVASNWSNATVSSPENFIEFVTSPNNPDGHLKKSVLGGSSVIHDHAYYWPHFSAIPAPADEDIMLFSMSKVSGHAGSRFGWAVIRNESVYKGIARYLQLNVMSTSHDAHLRILKIMKAILATDKNGAGDIFRFGHETMKRRWHKLNAVLSLSRRFSLQVITPQYCTYFKRIRDPSPAYAWLKCEMEEDRDCYAVLRAAGIISRQGTLHGADSRHVRLSLIRTQDDFDLLLQRINTLINTGSAKAI